MHEAFPQRLLQRQGMDNEHIIYFLSLTIGVMIFTGHPMTLELEQFSNDCDNFPNLFIFSSKKAFILKPERKTYRES